MPVGGVTTVDSSLYNYVTDVHGAHDYASKVGDVDGKYFCVWDTIKV